jgi:GrpB-like predicted nucleotidyltransferase (UPF0157 family)
MKIIIEGYQASWVNAFHREEEIIASVLIAFSPAIEHIGSTAISGLCAKPTIDILVGLRDEIQLDKTVAPMIAAGYTYFKKYEPAMPYRRLFAKLRALTDTALPEIIGVHDEFIRGQEFIAAANIHVIAKDTSHWKRHLAFRDFLRAHTDLRDEYAQLKQELSKHEFKDTNEYNRAKDSFIKRVEEQALAWYTGQHKAGEGTQGGGPIG